MHISAEAASHNLPNDFGGNMLDHDREWFLVLSDQCRQARDHNHRLRALTAPLKPTTLREHFALAAVDLGLEHHSAVVRCVAAHEFGSAAALLRPLLEAGAAAFWFVYAASVKELASLSTSTDDAPLVDLPGLSAMVLAIEPKFPMVRTLLDGLKNGGPAKWLHKYVHGGTSQLARRTPGSWHPEEVRLIVLRADIFACAASAVGTLLTTDPALSRYVFPARDALGATLSEGYPDVDLPQQPHALPLAPLLACGGGPPP